MKEYNESYPLGTQKAIKTLGEQFIESFSVKAPSPRGKLFVSTGSQTTEKLDTVYRASISISD
jgi:hypothetical protein